MKKELVVSEYTGRIVVHNVPAAGMTYGYICHVLKNTYEWFEGETKVTDIREEEGDPVYLNEISDSGVILAITQIGLAQNFVANKIPPKKKGWIHEKYR